MSPKIFILILQRIKRAMFLNIKRSNFACNKCLHKILRNFYCEVIQKIDTQCNKCLDRHGDYLEKYFTTSDGSDLFELPESAVSSGVLVSIVLK